MQVRQVSSFTSSLISCGRTEVLHGTDEQIECCRLSPVPVCRTVYVVKKSTPAGGLSPVHDLVLSPELRTGLKRKLMKAKMRPPVATALTKRKDQGLALLRIPDQ